MKTKTYKKGDFDKLVKKTKWYWLNDNLTEKNFPITTTQTENWKVIRMEKSFTSQEALDRIKAEGCRPATAFELLLFKENHSEEFKPWKWMLAFGQTWTDAVGRRRVPGVRARGDGGFGFDLGYFEGDWNDDYCLLCLCDETFDSQTLKKSQSLDTLPLELTINGVVYIKK